MSTTSHPPAPHLASVTCSDFLPSAAPERSGLWLCVAPQLQMHFLSGLTPSFSPVPVPLHLPAHDQPLHPSSSPSLPTSILLLHLESLMAIRPTHQATCPGSLVSALLSVFPAPAGRFESSTRSSSTGLNKGKGGLRGWPGGPSDTL